MSPVDAEAPVRAFSKVRRAQGLVFVSGEVAHTPVGVATPGVAAQTAQVLTHLASTLAGEGLDLNDVVQVTVHLRDGQDFAEFDRAYLPHFTAPYPVRTTVVSAPLYPGAGVELTVVATLPSTPDTHSGLKSVPKTARNN